jgi:hypothetical protein
LTKKAFHQSTYVMIKIALAVMFLSCLPTRDNLIHVGELLVFLLIIIQFIEFAYYLPIKSSILHILKWPFSIFIVLKCHLTFDH